MNDEDYFTLVKGHPWLSIDIFVLALGATMFLGYGDFDLPMRRMTRGIVVAALWLFQISCVHLLLVVKRGALDERISLGLLGARAIVLVAYTWWAFALLAE
jgi:hypothetical protein